MTSYLLVGGAGVGIEPGVLLKLGEYSTIRLYSQPSSFDFGIVSFSCMGQP